jgi:hypothetical protein
VELDLSGPPATTFVLQKSTDLRSWIPIATNVVPPGGVLKFGDPVPASEPRFYRAVQR